jgi:hypothetical protein
MPSFSRLAAIPLLLLAAACSTPRATTTPPTAAGDPLVSLNDMFRAEYRQARAERLTRIGTVIVVQFDDLHLIRQGQPATKATFTPPIYHEYKAIAHIPLALYLAFAPRVGRPFDKPMLDKLTAYLKQVQAAGKSLDGRAGWTPEQLRLHKNIVDASIKLIETAGGAEEISEAQLTAYTRAMRPLVLASADAAARAQLDGLHALVNKWRGELGESVWQAANVVVLGPKQPRPGNVQYEYFRRAMGPGAEGRRLWYAEGVFDRDGGHTLFGTIILDRGASIAFFNDPVRLERDLLADAAAAHLNRLFPRRR